jgi:hypothetical protein
MTAHCRPDPIRGHPRRNSRGTSVVDRRAGSAVTTWISYEEYCALEADAKARDISKSALMRQLIQDHLAAHWGPP